MSKKIFALSLILIFLCSCVETVVVGTVASGVVVAKSNKESKTENKISENNSAKDGEEIKKSIKKAFKAEDDSSSYRNIKITVFKGRVLLSGYVREAKYKQAAAAKASAAQPNNEIINEIMVLDPNENISGLNDYFIAKKISIRLNKLKDVELSDYKYSITNSVAIVIGKSQNKFQMDEITKTISTTRGVKKVISYIQY